jgi:cytosine/adenosine deaminase-related metal-dependent hydrolase/ubiquinone/menaquinone biosynthesis C-methylase UbiE
VNPGGAFVEGGPPQHEPQSVTNPFDEWADVYDEGPNPLLQLEHRYLAKMLPSIHSLDVLDAGCGTGRWLQMFAAQSPRSLTGVDGSAKMLSHAVKKLGDKAELRLGECVELPVPSRSMDLILASFVISYLSDLDAFAAECDRVCRANGNLFVTDMHPATALAAGWKRSFKTNNTSIEIEPRSRTLPDVLASFQTFGFKLAAMIEPIFGSLEQSTLQLHGKSDVAAATAHLPPIYLLHLRKPAAPEAKPAKTELRLHLTGGHLALGTNESAFGTVEIDNAHIETIAGNSSIPHRQAGSAAAIDLSGYLVLPGLINAHDHLEFGLYPNLGHGPYANAGQWADDIHRVDSALIEQHRAVPKDVRLWWGAIRNLLCGVTTVCHHNPVVPELLDDEFPVRVVSKFGWAHSLTLDPDLAESFRANWPTRPFILHAAEGTDERSANEVIALDLMNALDSRTVLVHGLALSPEGVSLINQRGAAVVLCPSSNYFLFKSVPSQEIVAALDHTLLGSDSSLTAVGDLLDEIRFAQSSVGLTPEDLYDMVTARAARILCLDDGEGHLLPGAGADLIAVRDRQSSPAETLATMHFSDVELVIVAGRVRLASAAIFAGLSADMARGLHPIEVDGHLRWIRAPLPRLFAEASRFLGPELRLGGKQVRHVTH